jgi:hypothetical protein
VGRRAWLAALFLTNIGAIGCGGGSRTTQELRILMASPNTAPVDVLMNGSQVATSVSYMSSTGYIPLTVGVWHVDVGTVSSSVSIFQQAITVTPSIDETLFITGLQGKIQWILLSDGAGVSQPGFGKVRLINASTTMGPADVYIVSGGTGIAGQTPVTSNLGFDQVLGYNSVTIGNYQIFMTAPGTTSVYLDTGPLALVQSQFKTVVVLDGTSGGFNYVVLTDI